MAAFAVFPILIFPSLLIYPTSQPIYFVQNPNLFILVHILRELIYVYRFFDIAEVTLITNSLSQLLTTLDLIILDKNLHFSIKSFFLTYNEIITRSQIKILISSTSFLSKTIQFSMITTRNTLVIEKITLQKAYLFGVYILSPLYLSIQEQFELFFSNAKKRLLSFARQIRNKTKLIYFKTMSTYKVILLKAKLMPNSIYSKILKWYQKNRDDILFKIPTLKMNGELLIQKSGSGLGLLQQTLQNDSKMIFSRIVYRVSMVFQQIKSDLSVKINRLSYFTILYANITRNSLTNLYNRTRAIFISIKITPYYITLIVVLVFPYMLLFFLNLLHIGYDINRELFSTSKGIVFLVVIISILQTICIVFLKNVQKENRVYIRSVTFNDVNNALKFFSNPQGISKSRLTRLRQVHDYAKKKRISTGEALRQVLEMSVLYFRPTSPAQKRTIVRLRYEILRMMLYEGATESQMIWDLGFDSSIRFASSTGNEPQPRYTVTKASEYLATSQRSFKRIKKEAIEMLKWKLESDNKLQKEKSVMARLV